MVDPTSAVVVSWGCGLAACIPAMMTRPLGRAAYAVFLGGVAAWPALTLGTLLLKAGAQVEGGAHVAAMVSAGLMFGTASALMVRYGEDAWRGHPLRQARGEASR